MKYRLNLLICCILMPFSIIFHSALLSLMVLIIGIYLYKNAPKDYKNFCILIIIPWFVCGLYFLLEKLHH